MLDATGDAPEPQPEPKIVRLNSSSFRIVAPRAQPGDPRERTPTGSRAYTPDHGGERPHNEDMVIGPAHGRGETSAPVVTRGTARPPDERRLSLPGKNTASWLSVHWG